MSRLIPDSIAGRTIVILVIGLGLFHLWSIWIYRIGTENLLGATRERGLAEHLLAARETLGELPPDQRETAAHALSTTDLEFHWSEQRLIDNEQAENERLSVLRRTINDLAPELTDEQVKFGYLDDAEGRRHLLLAAMQLPDETWITVGVNAFHRGSPAEHDVLGSLTAMALGILVVSIILVRSMTAPLRALANAAERIGTDISAQGAPEQGPREIRQVAHAFNTMQARIKRLITDRTQTLAAVSHDLKTPLTRLRLRAEFIPDGDVRQMIETDLNEMERMLDSTLAFLRGDSTQEESRTIDIGSVLKTICDQAADAGSDVVLSGSDRAPLLCRPLAVKRALSNLIDNAVKYGRRARVSLEDRPTEVVVIIDDDGPGVPAAEQERVFDPFYRVEQSRSRETGGTGLGLTIARAAIRGHGGDISVQNRQPGGLRVVVCLPKANV